MTHLIQPQFSGKYPRLSIYVILCTPLNLHEIKKIRQSLE